MLDVVIAGGGPVGLVTAIQAARRGLSAVVLERRRLPLDKACGEGLMPAGVRELEAMGIEVPAQAGQPFFGVRYLDGSTIVDAHFRPERHGLAVRRTTLVRLLAEHARGRGVPVREGVEVLGYHRIDRERIAVTTSEGDLEARYVIAADGLHSRLRGLAGLSLPGRANIRYGVRRHFRVRPWSQLVEVHWSDGAEAYVSPLGPELVGVAFLVWGTSARYASLLGRFPQLVERLRGAEACSDVRGAGPFEQRVRRRTADGLALVGDAAGYVDAITGEGLTLGFRCATALTQILAAGRPLADYDEAYLEASRGYYRSTRWLLAVAARPRMRRRLIAALSRSPRLFDVLVAAFTGEPAPDGLRPRDVLRFAGALL